MCADFRIFVRYGFISCGLAGVSQAGALDSHDGDRACANQQVLFGYIGGAKENSAISC
jgi:hypothetical protein